VRRIGSKHITAIEKPKLLKYRTKTRIKIDKKTSRIRTEFYCKEQLMLWRLGFQYFSC